MAVAFDGLVFTEDSMAFFRHMDGTPRGFKDTSKEFEWGVVSSKRCVLCWRATEMSRHLLHNCKVTRTVWNTLLTMAGYNHIVYARWEDEVRWIVNACRGKGFKQTVLKLLYNGFVFHIWQQRNRVIFNNAEVSETGIVQNGWRELMDLRHCMQRKHFMKCS